MICLDNTAALSPDVGTISHIRRRGGLFVWSDVLDEWMIVARDLKTKRRVVSQYRRGVVVLTLDEVMVVDGWAADDLMPVMDFVREMGTEIGPAG